MEGRFVDTKWGEITPNYGFIQKAKNKGGVPETDSSFAWVFRSVNQRLRA